MHNKKRVSLHIFIDICLHFSLGGVPGIIIESSGISLCFNIVTVYYICLKYYFFIGFDCFVYVTLTIWIDYYFIYTNFESVLGYMWVSSSCFYVQNDYCYQYVSVSQLLILIVCLRDWNIVLFLLLCMFYDNRFFWYYLN